MSLKNPVTTPGIDPGTVRLVAQRLNHYANTGPIFLGSDLHSFLFYIRAVFVSFIFVLVRDTVTRFRYY
jgi:hypothetical protein